MWANFGQSSANVGRFPDRISPIWANRIMVSWGQIPIWANLGPKLPNLVELIRPVRGQHPETAKQFRSSRPMACVAETDLAKCLSGVFPRPPSRDLKVFLSVHVGRLRVQD